MFSSSAACSSGSSRKPWKPEEDDGLFKQVSRASHFLRDVRFRFRYGELSRAPLRMLRFHMDAEILECDWMARMPDPWDIDLSRAVQQRHATLQALKDALGIRALLFEAFPDAESASIRVFRESVDYKPELVISGCLHRNDNSARGEHSIVMRAKILGFRFRIDEETLCKI